MARREIGEIEGLVLREPQRFADERGFFSETYSREALRAAGFDRPFVQDNHSLSRQAGTLRGLHYQVPPAAQDKLVRVVRGALLDIAVDLRDGSPTRGDHAAIVLSAENWLQLLVPAGFAHGFLTLEPDTEVLYKVSAPYSREHDRAILWSDPDLGIEWGIAPDRVILSDKDRAAPRLRDIPAPFPREAAGEAPRETPGEAWP
jgi:dTDP-4-dehydrorhamnose 3,5-epimerase